MSLRIDEFTSSEFIKSFNKVKKGKKKLSNRKFLRFQSKDLNSLGKFCDKQFSEDNLKELISDYKSGKYKIRNYTCVVLPKSNGGFRTILVPNPRDRIIFSIILERLKKVIIPKINNFNVFGSGERKDFKNIKTISEEVYKTSRNYKYILKIDIKAFFPTIDREILLKKLGADISNIEILKILNDSFDNHIRYTFVGVDVSKMDEIKELTSGGIPQGCAYSPLLANYYALDLDQIAKDEACPSFRYLDDMILFCNSEQQAKDILKKLQDKAQELGLKIHGLSDRKNNKTYIQKPSQPFEYLGIETLPNGDFQIPISKIKKEVKLIRSAIVNQETMKRFSTSVVADVLLSHLKGWRDYYQNNFPTAYQNFKNNNPTYNLELKKHYENHPTFKRFVEKKLGMDISNKTLYL